MPLVADDIGYYLFEPLAHTDEEKRKLGEDVNEWLTKVFGEGDVDDITFPTLNIPAEYNKAAKEFYQKLADKNKFITLPSILVLAEMMIKG